MISIPLNLPLNDYLSLPDCPYCKKGKMVVIFNAHAEACMLCGKSIKAVDRVVEGNLTPEEAIKNWT